MIYLSVLFILLYFSFYYDINGKTKGRNFFYRFMLLLFILIAGFRWRLGVDTPNYLYNFYHYIPTLDKFSFTDYSIGQSPFFVLMNSLVKSCGGRFYIVQLIHATIVNVLVFRYIKRHSSFIFTSVFFYAIFAYTSYNMEIMRGSLSIVICLFANDCILEKKWMKGYFLLIVALFFHPQTIVMFLMPFLFFLRLNKIGIMILVASFFVGIVIMQLFGDYLWIFEADENVENKISNYINSEHYGEQGGEIGFFVASCFIPIIYMIYSLLYAKRNKSDNRLLVLEPFIMLCILFVVLRMNVNIAYRYVDYYKIYFCLFYANLFVQLIRSARQLNTSLSYIRSLIIFIPFFLLTIREYVTDKGQGYRYFPYTSVFERTIDKERQLKYNEIHSTKYPFPNTNEY